MKKQYVLITGGGSGGHALPAVSFYEHYKAKTSWDFLYVGSMRGVERTIAQDKSIPYVAISTGKLRRYLSVENILDVFRTMKGIAQSIALLQKYKPKFIFSTGGFVALPLCCAGWLLRVPVYIHEQTTHVGLANKICSYFAKKVFITFASSSVYFPAHKVIHSGYPLRANFYSKIDPSTGFKNQLFDPKDKVLLILGGGNGSVLINSFTKSCLEELVKHYKVILQCGQMHLSTCSTWETERFQVFGFLGDELLSLMERADLVIARSGAGTVCEMMALKKRVLFIPLAMAQKNEQFYNACEAKKSMQSFILEEKDLARMTGKDLVENLENIPDPFCQVSEPWINSVWDKMDPYLLL
jgi:UDP-N-acetylglucosamine--N-acetylmuramyl-(pentapeptide) pyrophosphoryl-undecaprenol N-acetylglucosamine transferase